MISSFLLLQASSLVTTLVGQVRPAMASITGLGLPCTHILGKCLMLLESCKASTLIMCLHRNKAGTVKLTSTDPRMPPDIIFHYYDEGTANAGNLDAQSVMDGVRFSREIINNMNAIPRVAQQSPFVETRPAINATNDVDLETWTKTTSWGHHASCSCPIGAAGDPMAVLDGQFRVRGTKGLRVVDASAFPKISGWFIVAGVMMRGEKAADVILDELK